jgi:methyl-accepting chemotaxis protein
MTPRRSAGPRNPLALLRDLRTATQLLAGFVAVCALVLGIGLFRLGELSAAQDDGIEDGGALLRTALEHVAAPAEGELLPLAEAGRAAELPAAIVAFAVPAFEGANAALDELEERTLAAAGSRLHAAEDSYAQARTVTWSVIAAVVVLAVVIASALGHLIAGPLRRAVVVRGGPAGRRPDQQLDIDTRDEGGDTGSAPGTAERTTAATVRGIGSSASTLSECAEESAQHAVAASRVAEDAVDAATTITVTMAKLSDSSAEIGDVVKVITSIAEQTDLLALNARIEAARAGEAGKGFAVVANEVKQLAQETAKVTEDIARGVEAIQADARAAVAAIDGIGVVVTQISDRPTTVAGAVEEQATTADEMARSVQGAAAGSTELARTGHTELVTQFHC